MTCETRGSSGRLHEAHGHLDRYSVRRSPLFTGGAGSGESEIRRWIIERDQLEAIVALPEQMFYNTGIGTFIWIVTNRKATHRKGKIQLIDARERWSPMKRSLGDKRRFLDQAAIDAITREHGEMTEAATSRVFDNAEFGYRRVSSASSCAKFDLMCQTRGSTARRWTSRTAASAKWAMRSTSIASSSTTNGHAH